MFPNDQPDFRPSDLLDADPARRVSESAQAAFAHSTQPDLDGTTTDATASGTVGLPWKAVEIWGMIQEANSDPTANESSRFASESHWRPTSAAHRAVFFATENAPRHLDDLCEKTGLTAALVQEALLTLTLEAVLVEGPAGWFRRSNVRKY